MRTENNLLVPGDIKWSGEKVASIDIMRPTGADGENAPHQWR